MFFYSHFLLQNAFYIIQAINNIGGCNAFRQSVAIFIKPYRINTVIYAACDICRKAVTYKNCALFRGIAKLLKAIIKEFLCRLLYSYILGEKYILEIFSEITDFEPVFLNKSEAV